MRGAFITMEGVEGSGKSTQIRLLAERLEHMGVPLLLSKEPGGTALGGEVRRLLLTHHASGEVWSPKAELLLFYADRAQHVATRVRPALEAGKVVLVDRFEDSSWAYQGARGVPDADLLRLRQVVLGDFQPDLTVMLDMDPTVSLRRVTARNTSLGASFQETRFDQEALHYHQAVRERFLAVAQREPDRVAVIQAEDAPARVADAVWEVVSALLRRHGIGVA